MLEASSLTSSRRAGTGPTADSEGTGAGLEGGAAAGGEGGNRSCAPNLSGRSGGRNPGRQITRRHRHVTEKSQCFGRGKAHSEARDCRQIVGRNGVATGEGRGGRRERRDRFNPGVPGRATARPKQSPVVELGFRGGQAGRGGVRRVMARHREPHWGGRKTARRSGAAAGGICTTAGRVGPRWGCTQSGGQIPAWSPAKGLLIDSHPVVVTQATQVFDEGR